MCNWTESYKEATEREKWSRICRKCGETYYADPSVDPKHVCSNNQMRVAILALADRIDTELDWDSDAIDGIARNGSLSEVAAFIRILKEWVKSLEGKE